MTWRLLALIPMLAAIGNAWRVADRFFTADDVGPRVRRLRARKATMATTWFWVGTATSLLILGALIEAVALGLAAIGWLTLSRLNERIPARARATSRRQR